MQRESHCLKVSKTNGQKVILLADKLSLREKDLKIEQDRTSIYVPLIRLPSSVEFANFKAQGIAVVIGVRVFQESRGHISNLADVLADRLPPHLLASTPKALDIVGDIAIVEIPPELKTNERLVGEAVMETHRNVKTVLAKAGAVSGTYRLRDYKVVAGESRTDTIHKEFGSQFHVDLAKAYFSPRLSYEHMRVASQVQDGETVVDLFSGVGPFAVLIGKSNDTVKIYAIDINPGAFELLKKNILVNRVNTRVIPFLGDDRLIVHQKLSGVADRVIMNMPESAVEFVDVACEALKREGGVVHFYCFQREPDSVKTVRIRFEDAVEKAGRRVEAIFVKTVRETAPHEHQVVFDATIN